MSETLLITSSNSLNGFIEHRVGRPDPREGGGLVGPTKKIVSYDLDFDRAAYARLRASSLTLTSQEFLEKKKMVDGEVTFNLKTNLGERFNVLLSSLRYNLRDGVIYGENSDERSLDVFIRGRDYRRAIGNPVDYEREAAEVAGFGKVQDVLGKSDAEIGTMMLSISPKGGKESTYQHNFYDVFTLKEDEGGRYIEARRYASSLSPETYSKKLREKVGVLINPRAEEFLANPVEINPKYGVYADAEAIHRDFHDGNFDFMEREFFESRVLRETEDLIDLLVKDYFDNPQNKDWQNFLYNAILNKADQVAGLGNIALPKFGSLRDEIMMLGRIPVRRVMVGCGLSEGASFISPMSVADFGNSTDRYGKRDCSKCHRIARPMNQLVENCQSCGISMRC